MLSATMVMLNGRGRFRRMGTRWKREKSIRRSSNFWDCGRRGRVRLFLLFKTKQPRLDWALNCGSDETWIQWATTRYLSQC